MNPETLRCRILDYTKREMYQHGADGLTMDDIARGNEDVEADTLQALSQQNESVPCLSF